MSRQHHNLQGILRDLRHAEQLELPIWWEFCDFVRLGYESTLVPAEGEDDDDGTVHDHPPDVDGDELADGKDDDGEPERHAQGRQDHGHAARRVGRVVDHVPGSVGGPAEPGLRCVRVRTVGAPVDRVTASTATPARTKATPSRKAVKRGTRKTARR